MIKNIVLRALTIFAICICSIFILSSCYSMSNAYISEMPKEKDIDYNQYLKKVWIIKDQNLKCVYGQQSFLITKIDNDRIEGDIAFGGLGVLALPECKYFSLENKDSDIRFAGVINGRRAKCSFDEGSNGYKGKIELFFEDASKINVVIEFENYKYSDGVNLPNGEYTFEPYNLADIDKLTDIRHYNANLNSWGKVNITTGYVDVSHPYAVAYITDEAENILYSFEGITNGIKIKDVLVEDFDSDGFFDIKIMLEIPEIEYIYMQTERGIFYDSKLSLKSDISELVTLP